MLDRRVSERHPRGAAAEIEERVEVAAFECLGGPQVELL
jgi:hypothetical protein